MQTTIDANTDSVSAVWYSLLGGKFLVKLEDPEVTPGSRIGSVVDANGNTIGSAQDYTYAGRGFAVHTKPYAGYVPCEQIVFVHELELF